MKMLDFFHSIFFKINQSKIIIIIIIIIIIVVKLELYRH